jgi:hypothetical protein
MHHIPSYLRHIPLSMRHIPSSMHHSPSSMHHIPSYMHHIPSPMHLILQTLRRFIANFSHFDVTGALRYVSLALVVLNLSSAWQYEPGNHIQSCSYYF